MSSTSCPCVVAVTLVITLAAGLAPAQISNSAAAPGNMPVLVASGSAVPFEAARIDVIVAPGDLVYILVGFGLSPTPLLGGQLELHIPSILPIVPVDLAAANGVASFPIVFPPLPTGVAFYVQSVVVPQGGVPFFTNYATFTTEPLIASVSSSSPAPDEFDVALTRETKIDFTRPIDPTSVDGQSVYATFGGQPLAARLEVAPDAERVTLFYDQPLPASALIRVTVDGDLLQDAQGNPVDADGDGTPGGDHVLDFSTVDLTTLPNTSVFGRVFASALEDGGVNVPLQGVTVSVDGLPSVSTTTDSMGNFSLTDVPVGKFFVHVNGFTTTNTPPGWYYPNVGKAWQSAAGQATVVGDIHLPAIAVGTLSAVSNTQPTTHTIDPQQLAAIVDPNLAAQLALVELTVPAGSLFADDGTFGGMAGVAPVAADRLPGTLPTGLQFPIVITVQTDGPTNFATPAPIVFPNLPDPVTGQLLPPFAKSALWSFDHDTGRFSIVGPMTVSADGTLLVADPGVGIPAPGWHGASATSQPDVSRVFKGCGSGFLRGTLE